MMRPAPVLVVEKKCTKCIKTLAMIMQIVHNRTMMNTMPTTAPTAKKLVSQMTAKEKREYHAAKVQAGRAALAAKPIEEQNAHFSAMAKQIMANKEEAAKNAVTVPCGMCAGKGRIAAYDYYKNGMCFSCNGSGKQRVK